MIVWPLRQRMYGMPPDFDEELNNLIAEYLDKGTSLSEVEDTLDEAQGTLRNIINDMREETK